MGLLFSNEQAPNLPPSQLNKAEKESNTVAEEICTKSPKDTKTAVLQFYEAINQARSQTSLFLSACSNECTA